MKRFKKFKKERGAIAVMTAVMLTVLLGFTALSIDIGLHHYLGAKLQNAADSAATAVGQKLEANEYSLEKCAYEYLAKNGYDSNGKYKDKVKAKVELKGVVNNEALYSTNESDEYISRAYIKVTVDVDDSTLFANALGINSLHLRKTSYVLVEPNYEGMPEALKYSIFAGASMGDIDTSADDSTTIINADNPAMDIQGSTGAGSGEQAFSAVVAVAENTINGVNDFVQNFKGWMNNTFGTNFSTDYNKLVNINVSEAVMNNDAHSNANIMIGVQALNAARSKDNDYTGNSATGDLDSNYIQNGDDRYNGLTDADDYGQVHFTAVDHIDFGYSNYAKRRAELVNGKQTLGNTISWALNNYLENQPEKTRVYVQNQQNVQVVQHVINILNEMDLDSCTSSSFKSASINDNAGDFELAARRYFLENNAISQYMQNKVLEQETSLTFDGTAKTVSLASQESIVYRVNQKVSGEYLDEYDAIEVDPEADVASQRQSRLAVLTSELSNIGYDKMYKNNLQASGFVYAGTADKDGGTLGSNQTEQVVLERYEVDGRSVPKGTQGAHLKYTYKFNVEGNKVNRNTDNVNSSSFTASSTQADRNATNLGAKYSITRTFKEKSDYIDMPNLAPYFTRQINQSIRDATKKRGQFTDGVTTGARNVKLAVSQAQGDLEEITDEVTYTDDTYKNISDATNKNSADSVLFKDFKANANSGLTKLTNTEQSLGGVNMSNHSFKGKELYNSDGTLRNALSFVNEYDDWNHGNNWFGHGKVNAIAEAMTFQNKEGTQEKNSVATKKEEIKNEYADEGPTNNKSYKSKKNTVNSEIRDVKLPNIEDITGEEGGVSAVEMVVATPTNPLGSDGIFLKNYNTVLPDFGGKSFKEKLNEYQVKDADKPAGVADSEVALPNGMDSPYADATIANPSDITINSTLSSITTPANTNGFSNGGSIGKLGSDNTFSFGDNKYYSKISTPYYESWGTKWRKDTYLSDGYVSYVTEEFTMTANVIGQNHALYVADTSNPASNPTILYVKGSMQFSERNWMNIGKNSMVVVNGNLSVSGNVDSNSIHLAEGAKLVVQGNITVTDGYIKMDKNSEIYCSGNSSLTSSSNLIVNEGALYYSKGYIDCSNITVNSTGKICCESYILPGSSYNVSSDSIVKTKEFRMGSSGYDITNNGSLYVTETFTWGNKITNNNTINCKGTITASKQDLINNGTINSVNISVGNDATRWLYNNGTINTTGDVWVNGQLLQNNNKDNISTNFIVGGNLTTVDKIINNPGTGSGKDAVIRVNGNLTAGNSGARRNIENNRDNNSAGASAYIYVGGTTYCSLLYNYEKSNFYSDGLISSSAMYNKANSQIVTDGAISTGAIENGSGSWISAKTTLTATGSVTNNGQLYSGTNMSLTAGLTSSGPVRAGGNMNLAGTVSITHTGFSAGGSITGSGAITCINVTAKDGIAAASLDLSKNAKTNGSVSLSGALTIGSGANLTAKGNVTAGSITNNNGLTAEGNITTTGEFRNLKDVKCFGNLVTGNLINGTTGNRAAELRCKGSITVGGYFENYNKVYAGLISETNVASGGGITVNGKVSDSELRSIRNYGDIYAAGSVSAISVLYSYGGSIYVYGDITACNNDNAGNNILEIKGSTKLYVKGCVTSSKSNRRIWMYNEDNSSSSSGTVISIYGDGKGANEDVFKNKLEAFSNGQPGSNVYINSKLYLSGAGAENDSWLLNSGRLYVNGEIDCPNLVSAWLTGNYDYGKTLAQDYESGYDENTPKYSGLTYCTGKLNAPNATIHVGDSHYVFVKDTYKDNYNDYIDAGNPAIINVNVKKVDMWGASMLYAPNEAAITETINIAGTAIFNVQNKVSSTGVVPAEGSNAQVVAPIDVEIAGGDNDLTGLSNVVFGSEKEPKNISTSSLRGTRVEIKIYGDLVVSGAINLTNSRLIVTGKIECASMTLNSSKVHVGKTLSVVNGSTAGALTLTSGSQLLTDQNLVKAAAISVDNSTLFVRGSVQNATSATVTNGGWLITRNSEQGTDGNHNNDLNLSGATTVSGASRLFVDGTVTTSQITADGASKLYGYTGIYINSSSTTVNVDINNHEAENSVVFFGENNTRDDITYNLQINGTIYLPPNKHYGNNNKLITVAIKDNGVAVIDSPITSKWVEVGLSSAANGKATLFCAGLITLKDGASYTNYGHLYAYGGTDIAGARTGGKNNPNFNLLKDNSDTFIGKLYSNGSELATWDYGYYEGHGDTFIDANLNVTNYSDASDKKVGNRGTAMYIMNGTTYVSGNVTLCNDNAFRSMEGAGLVCQKDFTIGCTIWNFGKLHIYGAFNMNNNATWITDNSDANKNPAKGWSLRNGWEEGRTDASFIAYNYGNKGGLMTFKGYVRNAGKIYMNYGLSVEGYSPQDGMYGDFAFVNWAGSEAQFSGEFRCNSNRFFNKWNTTFGCDGRLTYSEIAYNCGQMYVGGDLINGGIDDNNYQSFSIRKGKDARDNGVGWLNINGSDSRSFSFMNGGYKVNADTSKNNGEGHIFKNAMLFVGGSIHLGDYESQKKAGTLLNEGTMYVRNDCKVYSWGGGEAIDSGPAFYMTSIMATNNSSTFIGGECYSGAALVTGKNSIFMCDGDLRVRRPLKVNMWFRYYHQGGTAGNVISYFEDHQYKSKGWLGSDDDGYRACYMRVGGSIYANVEGRDLENSLVTTFLGDLVPYDHSRDIDIQANANIVIGGGFYCPQKLYMKQNVKMIICNQDNGIYDNNGNLNWKARGLDELSDSKNNPLVYGPGVTDTLTKNVNSIMDWIRNKNAGEECALFAYQLLDMNICSTLVVNGNAYVRDTCKIRDMTKTYINGDFIARDYLEIGKSLSESQNDATEARLDKYKNPGENDSDYVFENAGYMYVKNDLSSAKYTKVYASTTVKVGGNMSADGATNGYITLRHDARLFVGGNMKATTSIDGGAYSEMYVGGNMTATLSNIKLRDQMTCYVGKNMTSPTYIELGKYDENFYRGVKNARIQQYLNEAGDTHADDRDDEQGSTYEGGEFGYNGDEHERKDNETSSDSANDNQTETENSETDNKDAVNDENELENDNSDLAVGGEYYVGGNIVSYTSYIREYAYTRTVSGGVVVALRHITLRHNSDLWVLPEVFGNTTYHTTEFEYPDGWNDTLWSTLSTTFQKIGHDLKEDFEPKPGSIYSLGQLSMNKNTSIFGTYDTMVFSQTVMRKGSLIFVGHDFDCWAPIYNLQSDFSSFSGFMDSMKANLGLSENKTYKGFDSYDSSQREVINGKKSEAKPIVIYANNEINIATTARIRYTYFIANRGNVNFTNLNFASETSEVTVDDAKDLPNGFASYQGDVNFYALRGTLGALMYAPQGNIDLDGFAYNFYGSMVGDTVDINTFYINVHRFNNWRTLDLNIASSSKVYLISEKDFENAEANVDDVYMYGYDKNPDPSINEWAQPFFPGVKTDTVTAGDGDTGYDDGFGNS